MAVRRRKTVADYLKVESEFAFMGIGFIELNESPSAKSDSKQYINETAATSSIVGYEPEFAFELDQIREEKVIDFICDIAELQKTGEDAETEYMKVDLDKPGTKEGSFRARKFKVAIEVSDLESKDGSMGGKGKFLQKGDLVLGTFDTSTKTFTEGWDPKPTTPTIISEGSN